MIDVHEVCIAAFIRSIFISVRMRKPRAHNCVQMQLVRWIAIPLGL